MFIVIFTVLGIAMVLLVMVIIWKKNYILLRLFKNTSAYERPISDDLTHKNNNSNDEKKDAFMPSSFYGPIKWENRIVESETYRF